MAFRFNTTILVICLQIICLELVLAKTSISSIKESTTGKIVAPANVNQFHEDNVDLNKNPNHHGAGNNVTVTYNSDTISNSSNNANEGQLQKRVRRNAERQRQLAERVREEKAYYAKGINAIKEKNRKAEEEHQAFVKRVTAGIELAKKNIKKFQAEYEETKRKRMRLEG